MNYRLVLFIALLSPVMAAIAACMAPIGSLDSSGSNSDKLMTRPSRIVYNVNDIFSREEDLLVFASHGGILESIPVDCVDISVIEDIFSGDAIPIPPTSGPEPPYEFKNAGRYVIIVSYNNLSDSYSVEIQDPYNQGNTGGNTNGGGIDVIWL